MDVRKYLVIVLLLYRYPEGHCMRKKLTIIRVSLSMIIIETAAVLSGLRKCRNSPNLDYRYSPSIYPDLSNSWMKCTSMNSRGLAVRAAGSFFAKSSRIVLKPSADG
jgi:hypothetical protein